MREHDFDPFSELELSELMNELPPDEELVKHITPWRGAMDRIVTGLALTTITLKFLWLDYLLPLIGTVMLFLGLRSLRRENKWFMLCYIISIGRLAAKLVFLIVNSTIWQSRVYAALDTEWAQWFVIIITFLNLFALWRGLRSVRRRAGLKPACESMEMLIFWNVILFFLAYIQYQGLIVGLFVIVMYVLIIKSLYAVAEELDEAGYDIAPAPVRLSDDALKKAIAAVLIAGVVMGYAFFHSYPMEWEKKAEISPTPQLQEVYDHLTELGFPRYVLEDMTSEDVLELRDAKRLVWDTQDHPVNEGREVTNREGNMVQVHTVYDVKELRLTGVAVELNTERESWKLIHHFQWVVDPGIHGTESIQMWPAYRQLEGWYEREDSWSGKLYYDYDGVTYAGDFYGFEESSYTGTDFFGYQYNNSDIFAEFSFPWKAENQRGYVSYTIDEMNHGWIVDSWINYTHQDYFFQYPVLTARDKQMQGGFNRNGCFFRVQDALQFAPTDEGPLMTFKQEYEQREGK